MIVPQKKYFIEVKSSVGLVLKEQIFKYTDINNSRFMNVKQKRVILYIDEPMETLSGKNAEELREIRAMGVEVVNGLEELKEVILSWEHLDMY